MQLIELLKKQPGRYFCISTKSLTGKWTDHFFEKSELDEIPGFVSGKMDHEVYFCPHGFTRNRRIKKYAKPPKMLWADLDEVDPLNISLKPSLAIESSPGRYVGLWRTTKPVTEDVNRRWSYYLESDLSGWDLTQVLRYPGTLNHKYSSKPRVKVLWHNGPIYRNTRIVKLLGSAVEGTVAAQESDVIRLYTKYEDKFSQFIRRELLHGKPTPGKRSQVLWRLQRELLETGLSRKESFRLLWGSPWNKFRNRRGGQNQLWKELTKGLEANYAKGTSITTGEDWNPVPHSMASVKAEKVEWIVPSMFARKEVTILEGDPGVGKSYLMQIIAGKICDGDRIPPLKFRCPQGRVVYFDTENTAGSVTKNRLVENDITNLRNFFQGEEPFSIEDTEKWELVLDRLAELQPTVVVFDTINTYLGSVDSYRSSEVQQAMGFFKDIAQRYNCSVVLLRHLTKDGKRSAIYRGQGSIAFTGAARIVISVGNDPVEEGLRVVVCTKNNISPFFKSFTYSIVPTPVGENTSRLVWGDITNYTADDILSKEHTDVAAKGGQDEWIKQRVNGSSSVDYTLLQKDAKAHGIGTTQLEMRLARMGYQLEDRKQGNKIRQMMVKRSGRIKSKDQGATPRV